MFNVIGKRYWFFLLSAIVIVPGTISLIMFGLNPSPDFVGGSEMEIQIAQTGQTTQLASLLASSTATPALPAGKVVSVKTGGTTITVTAPVSSASTKIGTAIQKATGVAPIGGVLLSGKAASCAPSCAYTATLLKTYTTTSPAIQKLDAALAKAYPAKGKNGAATVSTAVNGQVYKIQLPLSGQSGALSNLFQGYATIVPTATTQLKSSTCHPLITNRIVKNSCTYSVLLPAPLKSSESAPFLKQFHTDYPKSKALAGVSPQSVNTVIGSVCKATCYDIRSRFLTGPQVAYFTAALHSKYHGPQTRVINANSVGGTVASSTKQNAIIAVAVAAVFILAYITFAFRKMPHPVRYGTAAIIAMLHDVLVVVGIFSILGKVLNMEIDATFVTALLTIIGFSVHDTIVIFDRIRENVSRRTGEQFERVVNHSVLQSFIRSINTSFTVVLTLGAIFLFTGEQIRTFVLAMLIGIISGTYSSIFNASPILVVWENHEWRRWLGRGNSGDSITPSTSRSGAVLPGN